MPKNDAETMAENLRSRMEERGIKSIAKLAKAVEKKMRQRIARETLRRWVRHGVAHIHGGDKESTRLQLTAVAQYLGFESIEMLWQKPAKPEAYRVLGELVVSDELYEFVKRLKASEFGSFVLSRATQVLDLCDAYVRAYRRVTQDWTFDDELARAFWDYLSSDWNRIRTMPHKSADEIVEEIVGGQVEEKAVEHQPIRVKRSQQKRLKPKADAERMRPQPSEMPSLGSSIERKPESRKGDHDEIRELQTRYERDEEEAEADRKKARFSDD